MAVLAATPADAHFARKPEQHYRYVSAPAGEPRTPPPASAQATAGPRMAASLVTGEPLAQAVVYVPPGGFGARQTVVRLEPRPPGGSGLRTSEPFTEVAGGTIIGNVYRLSVAGDAPLRTGAGAAEIRLRPPFEVVPEPVVARRAGGRWVALPTRTISGGIFAATLPATGDFALVVRPGEGPGRAGRGALLLVLVPLLALLVLAGLGAARARRRRLRGSSG